MARFTNQEMRWFVSTLGASAEMLRLGRHLSTPSDESEDETEDESFLDGDGVETDVTGHREGRSFEGYFNPEDPAQKLIAGLKLKRGDEKKIKFREVRPDGYTLEGPAVVTDIVTVGGDAHNYADFSFTITWVGTPEETTTTTPEG